tara:strand:- start:299 stop:865 length:567 start_codon:yes stop_codon:yes gene_type:complete
MKNNTPLIYSVFDINIINFFKVISIVILGTLLLSISSKIQVPFWPVPMTMQTFIVFLIGMTYGFKLASLTLVVYLIEGALGLPVFAKGGGLVYLSGPTAGYLYGMVCAAGIIGFFADRGFNDSYFKSFMSLVIGAFVIFLFGVGYLASIIGYDKAMAAGLYPFILSEFFKIGLASAVIPTVKKLLIKK